MVGRLQPGKSRHPRGVLGQVLRYQLLQNTRGFAATHCPSQELLIITTNETDPAKWFPTVQPVHLEAILRRIDMTALSGFTTNIFVLQMKVPLERQKSGTSRKICLARGSRERP